MEQTTTTTTITPNPAPQGKGMGVAGFVISLVALVFYWIVAPIVVVQAALGGGYGLSIFWLILSLLGTGLSVMGMMKLGKTGGKRGLAITGMILGIIALVMSVLLVMSVGKTQQAGAEFGDKFKEGMEQGLQQMQDSMNIHMDELKQAMDTTQHN